MFIQTTIIILSLIFGFGTSIHEPIDSPDDLRIERNGLIWDPEKQEAKLRSK